MHPRVRYPLFKQLMWYTAAHYAHSLQAQAGLSQQALQGCVVQKLQSWVEAVGAGPEAAPAAGQAALRADSDSVMGTSKAGTTAQVSGLAACLLTCLPTRLPVCCCFACAGRVWCALNAAGR